ncbi:TlpA family protein disulfide reductase [Membranihabitans maritimus]|uniref:TlpA family protein disulfide reductase n=1 Tax=Membranihabitans maritimus TaxID=2904244 RepID=UPI001F018E3B|nr:thioredoxin-like domain-containing protein [Membranihabitans maritimus]
MIKIYFAILIIFFSCEWHKPSSINKNSVSDPFAYTIILKDVEYTNGFDLENGIKTRTRFKCPLYFVDSLGVVREICLDNGTNDTIVITHSQDQLELVHTIRGLNFFYYLLDSGDTLSLQYEDGIPISKNPKQNTSYNLLKDNPFESMRQRYFLVLRGPVSLYPKFKSKKEIPPELERLRPFYRNLDSLYFKIKKSHAYQLDYVRNHTGSPDYWTNLLNKEMRKLVLGSRFINKSDTSLYGGESDFNVYSISDRFYYKAKFNQNPDSIFNKVQNNDPGMHSELARYYFQLYLNYSVNRGISLKSINSVISQYYNAFAEPRDSVFIQKFRKKMGVEESLAKDINIISNRSVGTTLNQLIQKDSASLYYIDFWASWCAPCREEIPYSIELKKELEEMGIRFIYLAYNDRMENWLKASRELNLNNYDHSWFITNSQSSQQLEDYNIKTIPRYMILDGNGKVLEFNAQRPSYPGIKKILISSVKGN